MTVVQRPYHLAAEELLERMEEMVDVTFTDLTSKFMLLPRGDAFLSYEEFLDGYEALRLSTRGFVDVTPDTCWAALRTDARAFVVLRTMVGVSPPEWQDLTEQETTQRFPSNTGRTIDSKVKRDRELFGTSRQTLEMAERVGAMLETACAVLYRGAGVAAEGLVHRLDKIDTVDGLDSIRRIAEQDVPYAVLLYERFLGRPYASHRDAVSGLVGDVMESAIEEQLAHHRVPSRKTRRAERVHGFDQAPDFFIPDEVVPRVIIEAKITGDDGTARDKVARILRLGQMRNERELSGQPSYQLIACIDGRGFGVRRQDMRDLLNATRGKVFTANTLTDLIPCTDLANYVP